MELELINIEESIEIPIIKPKDSIEYFDNQENYKIFDQDYDYKENEDNQINEIKIDQ